MEGDQDHFADFLRIQHSQIPISLISNHVSKVLDIHGFLSPQIHNLISHFAKQIRLQCIIYAEYAYNPHQITVLLVPTWATHNIEKLTNKIGSIMQVHVMSSNNCNQRIDIGRKSCCGWFFKKIAFSTKIFIILHGIVLTSWHTLEYRYVLIRTFIVNIILYSICSKCIIKKKDQGNPCFLMT